MYYPNCLFHPLVIDILLIFLAFPPLLCEYEGMLCFIHPIFLLSQFNSYILLAPFAELTDGKDSSGELHSYMAPTEDGLGSKTEESSKKSLILKRASLGLFMLTFFACGILVRHIVVIEDPFMMPTNGTHVNSTQINGTSS